MDRPSPWLQGLQLLVMTPLARTADLITLGLANAIGGAVGLGAGFEADDEGDFHLTFEPRRRGC